MLKVLRTRDIRHLNAIWFSFLFLLCLPAFAQVVGSIPGEFSVSESGAATYTIPISVSPGTAGMEPKVALTYNSQSDNGLLGMGWSLSGLSVIHRCAATVAQDGFKGGINYNRYDRFCLDGQRLVRADGNPEPRPISGLKKNTGIVSGRTPLNTRLKQIPERGSSQQLLIPAIFLRIF